MTDLVERLRALLPAYVDMPHAHTAMREAAAELSALRAERDNLKSVMIAAAEEISAHWQAHCDAEGYGPANLMRRLEEGIPSEYAYKAGDFERLRAERDALRADAERYRLVRRGQHWSVVDGIGNHLRAEALDAKVDEVMAKGVQVFPNFTTNDVLRDSPLIAARAALKGE